MSTVFKVNQQDRKCETVYIPDRGWWCGNWCK